MGKYDNLRQILAQIYKEAVTNNAYGLDAEQINNLSLVLNTLAYLTFDQNLAIMKNKRHLFFPGIKGKPNSQRNFTPIHLENYSPGVQGERELIGSLVTLFIHCFHSVQEAGHVKEFCSKLTGNCIDGRTRLAFDYALTLTEAPTFSDHMYQCYSKMPKHLSGDYFEVIARILSEKWGEAFAKEKGKYAYCKVAGTLNTDQAPLLRGFMKEVLLLEPGKDFLLAKDKVPAHLLPIFCKILLTETVKPKTPDEKDSTTEPVLYIQTLSFRNSTIEQSIFDDLMAPISEQSTFIKDVIQWVKNGDVSLVAYLCLLLQISPGRLLELVTNTSFLNHLWDLAATPTNYLLVFDLLAQKIKKKDLIDAMKQTMIFKRVFASWQLIEDQHHYGVPTQLLITALHRINMTEKEIADILNVTPVDDFTQGYQLLQVFSTILECLPQEGFNVVCHLLAKLLDLHKTDVKTVVSLLQIAMQVCKTADQKNQMLGLFLNNDTLLNLLNAVKSNKLDISSFIQLLKQLPKEALTTQLTTTTLFDEASELNPEQTAAFIIAIHEIMRHADFLQLITTRATLLHKLNSKTQDPEKTLPAFFQLLKSIGVMPDEFMQMMTAHNLPTSIKRGKLQRLPLLFKLLLEVDVPSMHLATLIDKNTCRLLSLHKEGQVVLAKVIKKLCVTNADRLNTFLKKSTVLHEDLLDEKTYRSIARALNPADLTDRLKRAHPLVFLNFLKVSHPNKALGIISNLFNTFADRDICRLMPADQLPALRIIIEKILRARPPLADKHAQTTVNQLMAYLHTTRSNNERFVAAVRALLTLTDEHQEDTRQKVSEISYQTKENHSAIQFKCCFFSTKSRLARILDNFLTAEPHVDNEEGIQLTHSH